MAGVVIRSQRETFLVLSVPQACLDLSILTRPSERSWLR
jgi:hypothetical protein